VVQVVLSCYILTQASGPCRIAISSSHPPSATRSMAAAPQRQLMRQAPTSRLLHIARRIFLHWISVSASDASFSLLVVFSFCGEVRADSPPVLSSPQTGGYWDEDWGHAVQQGQEAPANGSSATAVLTAAARAAYGAACAAATAHMLPRSWLDNDAVFQLQQCGESSQLEASMLLPPMSRLRRRRHRHRVFQAADGKFDNRTAEPSRLQTRKDIASSSDTDGWCLLLQSLASCSHSVLEASPQQSSPSKVVGSLADRTKHRITILKNMPSSAAAKSTLISTLPHQKAPAHPSNDLNVSIPTY